MSNAARRLGALKEIFGAGGFDVEMRLRLWGTFWGTDVTCCHSVFSPKGFGCCMVSGQIEKNKIRTIKTMLFFQTENRLNFCENPS